MTETLYNLFRSLFPSLFPKSTSETMTVASGSSATGLPKDWILSDDGTYNRPLVGGEILMAWAHDNRKGGGRFTGGIDIKTPYGIFEVEQRLKTAWLRTRLRHPLLGITFKTVGRGGTMSYNVFPNEEFATNWRRNTLFFLREGPDAASLEDLIYTLDNHNTHPADGHAKLYAVPRANGTTSLVLNASHALLDFFSSGVVWQTLLDEFALADELRESEEIRWGPEIANLPRAIANVMSEVYPQSWWQWLKSIISTVRALTNVGAESIRPPLHPDLVKRPLGTSSHTHVYSAEETTKFVKRCKEAKTTVTYAYIAILALAMQDLYGEKSSSSSSKPEHQVFAMPYNGRRWLEAGISPAPPASPSLGNTTAYIRIPHAGSSLRSPLSSSSSATSSTSEIGAKELSAFRAERVRRIVEFGDKYKEESIKVINAPTPGGVLASRTLVPMLIKAVEKSDPQKPRGALFGVISQGQLDKMFPAKANVEGSDVTVVDYRNGGRTVDNNPLMILYTWKGRMHARYKWNSKYFDQKTFEEIDAKVLEYLNDFVAAGSDPVVA